MCCNWKLCVYKLMHYGMYEIYAASADYGFLSRGFHLYFVFICNNLPELIRSWEELLFLKRYGLVSEIWTSSSSDLHETSVNHKRASVCAAKRSRKDSASDGWLYTFITCAAPRTWCISIMRDGRIAATAQVVWCWSTGTFSDSYFIQFHILQFRLGVALSLMLCPDCLCQHFFQKVIPLAHLYQM